MSTINASHHQIRTEDPASIEANAMSIDRRLPIRPIGGPLPANLDESIADNRASDDKSRGRLAKLLTSVALFAGLASCTSVAPDPYLTTQAVTPEAPPAVTDVSPDFAAAYLPTFAGAIRSVRQKVGDNALHQEIVYDNRTALPGENLLTVDIGTPGTGSLLRPPGTSRVKAEMRAALPGLNPSIVPVMASNSSGVYGYAVAKAGEGACLYAWQYVKQVMPSDASGFAKMTRKHLSASIRLRYCDPALGPDRIHALMDGLKLKQMGSETIGVLRFAASSANTSQPLAVVSAEPVPRPKKVIRQRTAKADDDDWRRPASATDAAADKKVPGFIDNAVAVPLPDDAAVEPVTEPVAEPVQAKAIADPVAVPLPE